MEEDETEPRKGKHERSRAKIEQEKIERSEQEEPMQR
jgi:hypothetical protein